MARAKVTPALRSTTVDAVLDALGNPVRRAILRQLRAGPLPVNAIADQFDVSRPAISRHLQTLRDAGLVEAQRSGTANLYAVRPQGLQSLRGFVDEFWDAALVRLEALARTDTNERPR